MSGPNRRGQPRADRTGFLLATFAAAFFLTLAYFSLVLFTKTHVNKRMTARKKTRNAVYRACGWTIVGSIALVAIDFAFFQNSAIQGLHPVLALESIMVWAFGISWLVKGEAILADLEPTHSSATRKQTSRTANSRS